MKGPSKRLAKGKPLDVWSADFETTGETNFMKDGHVRVWLWSLVGPDGQEHHGTDLTGFMGTLWSLHPRIVYFHNLAFDGQFILDWMVAKGWEHGLHYTVSVDDMNQWFRITINCWQDVIEIRDSLKKFPNTSVQGIAKMFGIPGKCDKPDFTRYIPEDYVPTADEVEYCLQDSRIVEHAVLIRHREGADALTLSSDAFVQVKRFLAPPRGSWRDLYPELSLEMDEKVRRTYAGGWVYIKPEHTNEVVEDVHVYDVNSEYPWVMSQKKLPYGKPVPLGNLDPRKAGFELFTMEFDCEFVLKTDKLPFIQFRRDPRYKATEHVEESRGPTRMCLTSVDWDLFLEHYEVVWMEEPECMGYHFKTGALARYIDHYVDMKNTCRDKGDHAGVYNAKTHINSPYGKMGMKPLRMSKIPQGFDDTGKVWFAPEESLAHPLYVPYATFTTAWARDNVIRTAQANYKRFVYADTDSVHLLGEGEGMQVDPHILGAWKLEGVFELGRYVRPKAYIHGHRSEGGIVVDEVKCAGMPDGLKARCSWDDFVWGHVWDEGKMMKTRCPGGCYLKSTSYRLGDGMPGAHWA